MHKSVIVLHENYNIWSSSWTEKKSEKVAYHFLFLTQLPNSRVIKKDYVVCFTN